MPAAMMHSFSYAFVRKMRTSSGARLGRTGIVTGRVENCPKVCKTVGGFGGTPRAMSNAGRD